MKYSIPYTYFRSFLKRQNRNLVKFLPPLKDILTYESNFSRENNEIDFDNEIASQGSKR